MGQKLDKRSDRLAWLGDMEPEYEDMLEWMLLVEDVEKKPPEPRLPLHWALVPRNLLAQQSDRSGMLCH
ncbi:MAG: hypothetical protein HQL77_04615 [Magnetococcales bacterium]|nr:hypothetical protein [Magnetococcales bacterium]MBF0414198.1 hypothetical protein [Magnetococcales bacterium]MBF0420194.1 hypothetical protein [Magnetococcales bacterium]MBF0434638.1 hypothetical protein [Magnetococcales bacterium]